MEKEFIPYELAVKLKELGFNEECLGAYDKKGEFIKCTSEYWDLESLEILNDYFGKGSHECLAPLWQQAANFLYICSDKKINISINGNDTYEELCEKFKRGISNFRDLQNNKSER